MISANFFKTRFTRKLAAEFFRLKKGIPRSLLAMRHLRGSGIEIGALHNPVFVGPFAQVRYVDRMAVQDLVREYPELGGLRLVTPDVVDNGEELSKFPKESLDFIIANHFIEHCEDPIRTIKRFSEKLREGGVLYLAVPDKRFTFDKERSSTTYEHLVEDHERGPQLSRESHYLDWARFFCPEGLDFHEHAKLLMKNEYSIHFHVWSKVEFLDFLNRVVESYQMPLGVISSVSIGDEAVFVMRKVSVWDEE